MKDVQLRALFCIGTFKMFDNLFLQFNLLAFLIMFCNRLSNDLGGHVVFFLKGFQW